MLCVVTGMGLTACALSCTGLRALGAGACSCFLLSSAAANSCKQLGYGHSIQSLMEEQRGGGEVYVAFYSVLCIKNHLPLAFQLCPSTAYLFKRRELKRIKINVTFKYLLIPPIQNPPIWRNCWFYFSCPFKWKIRIFIVNTGLSELSILFLFWMVL